MRRTEDEYKRAGTEKTANNNINNNNNIKKKQEDKEMWLTVSSTEDEDGDSSAAAFSRLGSARGWRARARRMDTLQAARPRVPPEFFFLKLFSPLGD